MKISKLLLKKSCCKVNKISKLLLGYTKGIG
jgi:hypothetical protein